MTAYLVMRQKPPYVSEKRIDDARKLTEAVDEIRREEGLENRQSYERFFNNLALFSGGTFALSITYLGYLKSGSKPVEDVWLLVCAWSLLLICVIFSLFAGFLHSHYRHYARTGEYAEKRKAQLEIEAEEIPNINVVNFNSDEDYRRYQEKLKARARECDEGIRYNKSREGFYFFLWKWGSRVARLAFALGLILLFSFAVTNI